MSLDISYRRRLELEFWKTDEHERPGANPIVNVVNKAAEARVFLEKLKKYAEYFRNSHRIVEVGGGQLWASVLVKHFYPDALVTGTDLSEDAICSSELWERIFATQLDDKKVCPGEVLPFSDSSINLAFVFQSAHHFGRHRRTLIELERILVPGGSALYLHEPVCRQYIHGAAYRRVNRKRPGVNEDVLIYNKIRLLGEQAGFEVRIEFSPTLTDRQGISAIYYYGLNKFPLLQYALPCCADFIFTKSGGMPRQNP